jgi:cystathionine beta-lyase/cystathionine gamma-synthase
MDPHAAFLLLRGIKTLAVRVERQNGSALRIAEFLARHPRVTRVHYPLLKEHPDYAIAKKQMAGAGCVLSIEVEGTGADARRVAEGLSLFTLAPSLGGVDSLVTIPVLTSHAMIAPELRKKMGVSEQLIRLSVGLEHVEDLIADLEKGLAVVGGARKEKEAVVAD